MILVETRTVYKSTQRGRSFLTRRAAVKAEAIAMIKQKYPTERSCYSAYGECEDPGFHWSELKRADVLLRRMMQKVEAASLPPHKEGE